MSNIVSKFTIEKSNSYKNDKGFRNNVNFILTFASVLIFGIFAIRPSIAIISDLLKQINDYKQVNSVLIEKITILNEVNNNQSKLEQETNLANSALPESPDEGNYIRNINYLSGRNNVQAAGISFTTGEEGGLGTLNFELTVYGDYSNIIKFIGDLNQLLRITQVESVTIAPENDRSSAVRAKVLGKTFFYND